MNNDPKISLVEQDQDILAHNVDEVALQTQDYLGEVDRLLRQMYISAAKAVAVMSAVSLAVTLVYKLVKRART